MKHSIILFALLTSQLPCLTSASAQTSGGPDAFGYVWRNNADAQGPAYILNDIKATGTQIIGLGDDNQKGPYSLGWDFRYYWTNYKKVWIGSNGWVGFQNIGNIAAMFPTIPLPAVPNNYIAPMMCDLTFTKTNAQPVPGATAWYWTNNVDLFIIQYDSVPYWVNNANGFAGRHTFQVILSGADSSITYHYKLMQAGTPAYGMANEGLTTGIENATGQIGLQVLTNVFPATSDAVKFYYPNPVTYQVVDATPAWNQNPENGGFFVSKNKSVNLKTDIANAGNQPITKISVTGEIVDKNTNQVWTNSSIVSALAIGADSMLTYPVVYNATTAGTYTYRSTTALGTDINSANDITNVEMVVVDTTQVSIPLSYTQATTSTAASAWGGNGGQGIYIEPPFYPATITSLDFMVVNSGVTGYHLVQIVDDNGLGNSPGTVLYLDSVAAATAANPAVYINVPVKTPTVINSGGVYVAWLENGDSLSGIGTDPALPLSNRNYEIIGGSWGSYRGNSVDDIMIKVNILGFPADVNELAHTNFTLSQAYPNPSTAYTMINYDLQKSDEVQFSIRNMLGQEMETLNLGRQPIGTHTLKVNTSKFAPGIYFYSIKLGAQEVTKKMVVSK